MGLRVELYVFLGDLVLAAVIGYVIVFMYRRLGRYDPELDVLIRYSIVFLVIAELGRITDILDDFYEIPVFDTFQWMAYLVSIVGAIYSIVHYIRIFERKYIPSVKFEATRRKKSSGEESPFSGSYVVFSKYRLADILEILKGLKLPVLAITRFPDTYSGFEGEVEVIWVTQLSVGVSPTSLHVIQGKVVEFMNKKRNAVIVIDCLEYLLLYNDFKTIVKFLFVLKDYAIASGNSLIIFVDEDVLSQQEKSLLLKEFEPL